MELGTDDGYWTLWDGPEGFQEFEVAVEQGLLFCLHAETAEAVTY